MRRWFSIKLIPVIFFSSLLICGVVLLGRVIQKKAVLEGRNSFTTIETTLPDGSVYHITPDGRAGPFIVIYFSADCYYCHLETELILTCIDDLEGISIYMISDDEQAAIDEFISIHNLNDYPAITVAQVKHEHFSTLYGVRMVPSLFLYDKAGVLFYSSSGFTPAPVIIDVIAKNSP